MELKAALASNRNININPFIESSTPSLSKQILASLTEAITKSEGVIYLVGNRLVSSLSQNIQVEDLKLDAEMLLNELENRPSFRNRAKLGDLIQESEKHYANSLAIVRRDDTDFMVNQPTLEALYNTFCKNIPRENVVLKSSLNEPDFMLLEVTDPKNENGVITFFASNHPASFREKVGTNIDLLKSKLFVRNDDHSIILNESSEVENFKISPVLRLTNIEDISPESQLAADIATRFLRHATTIRVDKEPIAIDITKSEFSFLTNAIANQYHSFWNSENPKDFRRMYELGVAKIALRKNYEMFDSSHIANKVLYQALLSSFVLAGN